MKKHDISLLIVGKGGQGIDAAGQILAKALFRSGWHVFGYAESENVIQGGLNTYRLRMSDRPVSAMEKNLDFILALDATTAASFIADLELTGKCLIDTEDVTAEDGRIVRLPMAMLAAEAKLNKARNIVGLGALIRLLGLPLEPLETAITEKYRDKSSEIVSQNIQAARSGHLSVNQEDSAAPNEVLRAPDENSNLITGGTLGALGAIKAGCKFFAAYPMTPSSSILHTLASLADEYGISVNHVEDEIAAINMAIGAGFAGVRSMTATSGGGYALMTEAIGLAGMIESPVVILEVQRPGPSTGLPTRTAQGDLRQVLHAGQGEFPHVVLAPGTLTQAFEDIFKAFNIAERYQCPVTVLLDKYLADQQTDVVLPDADLKIDHGKLLAEGSDAQFQRYASGEDGIPIRSLPGQVKGIHTATSYEHGPDGQPTEDPVTVEAMNDRRLAKMTTLSNALSPISLEGPEDAAYTIICWGSTYGIAKEIIARHGSLNLLHFRHINPLPANTKKVLSSIRNPILLENNATGQLGGWLREKFGLQTPNRILNHSGRPFYVDELDKRISDILGETI